MAVTSDRRPRAGRTFDYHAAHPELVRLLLWEGLAAWWQCVPQLAGMLTGADDDDPIEHARRRATVVRDAQRLALPLHEPVPD